ncbi:MAG: DUF4160 domain-containing protein [Acidobacteriota bacterium]
MPEICRFYGIVIKMYFADHAPPHFHAEYGEYEARIAIQTLAVITGWLPPRAMGLVAEWATLHQAELQGLWDRASRLEPLHRLDPLP